MWPLSLSHTNLQLLAECETPGKPLDSLLTPFCSTVSADVLTCYYCLSFIPMYSDMEDYTGSLFCLLLSHKLVMGAPKEMFGT